MHTSQLGPLVSHWLTAAIWWLAAPSASDRFGGCQGALSPSCSSFMGNMEPTLIVLAPAGEPCVALGLVEDSVSGNLLLV